MKVAVIGAGWAGLACAVEATRRGHDVTLIEAARTPGGRARRICTAHGMALDNGQHILIGAYTATLGLMRDVGIDIDRALLRLPLSLRFADGGGLAVPAGWPAPLDLLVGIAGARGWTWADRIGLIRRSLQWRRQRFVCAADLSVANLCRGLGTRVIAELIEPLCVSALNTPIERASGQVFLRVLHDSLFSTPGGADLLLPRVDLGALFPDAAVQWLAQRGAAVRTGVRVKALQPHASGWTIDGALFDCVVLAVAPWDAARLMRDADLAGAEVAASAAAWAQTAEALTYESIATVYATGAPRPLAAPMLALRSSDSAPAQFVFDRGQFAGQAGLLAFVISASNAPREVLQAAVLAQARDQLGFEALTVLQTVVEKRATFACTPGFQHPSLQIAHGLVASGDYVDGPYPATLEGAVRSGIAAAQALQTVQPGSAP